MIVRLRRNELLQALSGYFRADVEDFVILPTMPSPMGAKIRTVVQHPGNPEYMIRNIKALREWAASFGERFGLQDGRWAMRNWETFIRFVDEYNRLPLSGFGQGVDEGILR